MGITTPFNVIYGKELNDTYHTASTYHSAFAIDT